MERKLLFFIFIFLFLSSFIGRAIYEQGQFISRNDNTLVLNNSSYNVRFGMNETTDKKFHVDGNSFFNGTVYFYDSKNNKNSYVKQDNLGLKINGDGYINSTIPLTLYGTNGLTSYGLNTFLDLCEFWDSNLFFDTQYLYKNLVFNNEAHIKNDISPNDLYVDMNTIFSDDVTLNESLWSYGISSFFNTILLHENETLDANHHIRIGTFPILLDLYSDLYSAYIKGYNILDISSNTDLNFKSTYASFNTNNVNMSNNLTVNNDINGERETINIWAQARKYTDGYIAQQNMFTSVDGSNNYILPYDGSIRSISCLLYTENTFIVQDYVTIYSRINGNNQLYISQLVPVTGGLVFYNMVNTSERNIYTFKANDILSAYIDFGNIATWNTNSGVVVSIEVQYDE